VNVPADVEAEDDAGSGREEGCGAEGSADDDMAGDAASDHGAVESDAESSGFCWVSHENKMNIS
jgi:hypothetical protein